MKKSHVFCLTLTIFVVIMGNCYANATPFIQVAIKAPTGALKMGDRPVFKGVVQNSGHRDLQGLVVYLSLVSLNPGHEHPVDLEDWSAQKAIRIDKLMPGETHKQDWPMRLIQSGRFGVALTVVDSLENRPIVSELVPFDIQTKPTVASNRILPVAIGEPLLLLIFFSLFYLIHTRSPTFNEGR